VVARVEVEHHDLAREVGELHRAAVGGFEGERRGLLANFEHAATYHVCYRIGMRGGLLVIALLACSPGEPVGPACPKSHARDTDGGESLAPRAAARTIASAVEDDRPVDRAAGDKAAATPTAAAATADTKADKSALGTVTVTEETITPQEMVIEIDDSP